MLKKQKLSPLVTLAKNDQEKTKAVCQLSQKSVTVGNLGQK